jgi:pyocin large subunit-like protein
MAHRLRGTLGMQPGPADTAEWPDQQYEYRHFRKHRWGLGVQTVAEYTRSARATIRAGREFTYNDPQFGDPRVGYYQETPRRFTALTVDRQTILTHFRPDAPDYARTLPQSTYRRR